MTPTIGHKERKRGATTEQLRGAIDRGATGSKVPHPDPAAAPLGTDDEAAGNSPTTDTVIRALQQEMQNPAAQDADGRDANAGAGVYAPGGRRRIRLAWLLLLIAAVIGGSAVLVFR